MKTMAQCAFAILLLLTLNFPPASARAQGTAFTYQGSLTSGGSPANGLFDFRFRLDADPVGNTILATVLTNSIGVTNGLFTTTIDFGAGWFNGTNYWLEVDVKTNNFATYTTLNPLQPLTPAPYAVMANSASNLLGILSAAQLSGAIANNNLPANPNFSGTVMADSFSGNGAALTSLNANNFSSGTVPLARLSGITSNQLAAGTWQLATNLNGGFATVATNVPSGIRITNAIVTGSIYDGDGGNLTNITAANVAPDPNQNILIGSGNVVHGNGTENTAVGYESFFSNNQGDFNTAIGYKALFSNTGSIDYSKGNFNTASGFQALYGNILGVDNVADGAGTLYYNVSGNNNTAIGAAALNQLGGFNSAGGTNNIALGCQAGYNFTGNESSNIDIGSLGVAGDNKIIRIGTPEIHTQTYLAGVVTDVGGVQVGTNGTAMSFIQSGQTIMPGSSLVLTNFTVTFPHPFTSPPKVIASLSGDPSFGTASDTFAMSIRAITTTTGFTINVMRIDTASGWSQQLRVNWQAWQ